MPHATHTRKRLVLASASPRRRDLLGLLGIPFEVMPSRAAEQAPDEIAPPDVAEALARQKALAVCRDCGDALVLGADTVVVVERDGAAVVLGKPTGSDDAREMLAALSGTSHTVYTGVALAAPATPTPSVTSLAVGTKVVFRRLSAPMIDAYLATGEPFDKAGAYGIQGTASAFVEAVHGDYFNVVGLPVSTVARLLEEAGIEWWRGSKALL